MIKQLILKTNIGEFEMPRVKAAPSRQVVIPKKFWDILHLKPGDLLDVELDEKAHSLVFTPKDVVDKVDARRGVWIKSLIRAGQEKPVDLEEEKITTDKKIKEQLFAEKYGQSDK